MSSAPAIYQKGEAVWYRQRNGDFVAAQVQIWGFHCAWCVHWQGMSGMSLVGAGYGPDVC